MIETGAGLLRAAVRGGRVRMQMPEPRRVQLSLRLPVNGRIIRAASVDTGVPHAVVPVRSLDRIDVEALGRAIRRHPRFAPHGTNVDFVETLPGLPGRIRVRTYERGVEAETPSCGTGVTAAAVIHALGARRSRRIGRARAVSVQTRSGAWLRVSVGPAREGRGGGTAEVVLEGPARTLFEGRIRWPLKGGA